MPNLWDLWIGFSPVRCRSVNSVKTLKGNSEGISSVLISKLRQFSSDSVIVCGYVGAEMQQFSGHRNADVHSTDLLR